MTSLAPSAAFIMVDVDLDCMLIALLVFAAFVTQAETQHSPFSVVFYGETGASPSQLITFFNSLTPKSNAEGIVRLIYGGEFCWGHKVQSSSTVPGMTTIVEDFTDQFGLKTTVKRIYLCIAPDYTQLRVRTANMLSLLLRIYGLSMMKEVRIVITNIEGHQQFWKEIFRQDIEDAYLEIFGVCFDFRALLMVSVVDGIDELDNDILHAQTEPDLIAAYTECASRHDFQCRIASQRLRKFTTSEIALFQKNCDFEYFHCHDLCTGPERCSEIISSISEFHIFLEVLQHPFEVQSLLLYRNISIH